MAAQEDNPPPQRKRRTRAHVLEDLSENHLEYLVLQRGHLLRRPSRDYGLDVTMFHFSESGELENGEVRFQLKATDNPQTTQNNTAIAVRVSKKDLHHWSFEVYPIMLIVFDASRESAYWVHIQDHLRETSMELDGQHDTLTVPVPLDNLLTVDVIDVFRTRSLAVASRLLESRDKEDEPRKPK